MHTTPATDPDVTATTAIQDRLIARNLTPAQHLMDAGYPSAANITACALRGITPLAPVTVLTGRNAKAGTFTPADFTIDWQGATATCPAGATSRSMRPDPRGLVTFSFSRRACTPCPIRARCTTPAPPMVRRITVHPQPVHQARMNAYRDQDSERWRTTYHQRAGIEGTISQAVRGPDLRHCRYRGLAKVHLQNVLTGIALNIARLGEHFAPSRATPRPATRIHTLCITHSITTA